MNTLEMAKNQISDFLVAELKQPTIDLAEITPPPKAGMGDLAYACFEAAKAAKANPAELAKTAAAKFQSTELVAGCTATGPYLNFQLDQAAFVRSQVTEILKAPAEWGTSSQPPPAADQVDPESGPQDEVMIEYASPNTHKELHVGHLRNLTLGLAIVNLHRAVGERVIPTCYIGDIGAHVAKCLWCLRKHHAEEIASPPPDKGAWLGRVYTEATKRIDENEDLKEEVAEVQRQLEGGDQEWIELWQLTREWSLDEMRAVYDQLGISLDRWYFEKEVEEPGKQMAKQMLEDGVATVGERNALIVDLEDEKLGVALILKSDGSSLYMTKELALAKLKFKEYPHVGHSIHVVDSRQSHYFRQFFAVLQKLGFHKKLTHLAYEFVTLKEGAMSSRQGNIITYQDFRDQMTEWAKAETKNRRPEWDDSKLDETAWAIAEAAMKFGMLKQDPDKPIVFDAQAALSFDGFTGPYLQYAHARLASILRKGEREGQETVDIAVDNLMPEELSVLLAAARFPETVAEAAAKNKPSVLAQYLFDFAQAISDFYRDVPVLKAETEAEKLRRLAITESLKLTLSRGLEIMGMKAPSEM